MSKLAVIFPGIGYHADKPLLYYSAKIADRCGYDVIRLSYSGFPENVRGDKDKIRQCLDIALEQSRMQLDNVDFSVYEDVLFVCKSIGTTVAGTLAAEYDISPRYILFTPVEKTFKLRFDDAIAFTGTNDPWVKDSFELRRLCDEKNIEVNIISDGNHSLETSVQEVDIKNLTNIMQKVEEYINRSANPNLKQAVNPYMASWEYVPDGEPYVFGDRVYVYGSHDMFGGNVYCMLDYICWSAPINDLGNWRYEGVIYKVRQDPDNANGTGMLYAPDVALGADGRYYLYYAVNNQNHISVAVCDYPAGQYEFYGYVHYADGTRLGDIESDEHQFDPGVLYEDGKVYLFTGFCPIGQENRHGPMLTVLDSDMITITEGPRFIAPSEPYSKGSGFEGHEFFEAPSIRKIGDKYTFIYSSIKFHELCYAQADSPYGPYTYKGVIISNGDLHIDTYKSAEKCAYYCANNHGSIEKVGDDWFIFYHRHTNGNNYCRQACFEKLSVNDDGTIKQAMMTSCGSVAPLRAEGVYPAYIACNLFNDKDVTYVPWSGWMDLSFAKITQDGRDGDMVQGYITNMTNGTIAGFKYFDCKGVKGISVNTMGYGTGTLEIRLSPDDEAVGSVHVTSESVWTYAETAVDIADGIHDLYFAYVGDGWTSLRDFTFIL